MAKQYPRNNSVVIENKLIDQLPLKGHTIHVKVSIGIKPTSKAFVLYAL